MIRFSLRTFLLLAAATGFAIAFVGSHVLATNKARQLQTKIEGILSNIYSPIRIRLMKDFEQEATGNPSYATFKAEHLPQSMGFLFTGGDDHKYSETGNAMSEQWGGVFSRSISLKRELVMTMAAPQADFSRFPIHNSETKVHVGVEISVPWSLIANSPVTQIYDFGAPQNEAFLNLLFKRLDDEGTRYQVIKIPRDEVSHQWGTF